MLVQWCDFLHCDGIAITIPTKGELLTNIHTIHTLFVINSDTYNFFMLSKSVDLRILQGQLFFRPTCVGTTSALSYDITNSSRLPVRFVHLIPGQSLPITFADLEANLCNHCRAGHTHTCKNGFVDTRALPEGSHASWSNPNSTLFQTLTKQYSELSTEHLSHLVPNLLENLPEN